MRKWLKEKRKSLVATGSIVLLVLFIASFVGGYWLKWGWTGFSAKTEWDWLGVLAIPVVVGWGAVWYTTQQGKVSDRENTDNQRETALQTYIDKISELLLEKDLRESAEGDEVRNIARVRTLTVLPRLNPQRKGMVLQFLYEASLIGKNKHIVDLEQANLLEAELYSVNLSGADLRGAFLGGVILYDVNLSGANLSGVSLDRAKLVGANLNGADLSNTYLGGVNLQFADLKDANLVDADLIGADLTNAKGTTDEQLSKVKLLTGAIMPDGTKHP